MASRVFLKGQRVVIKVGSALLCDAATGALKADWVQALADDIAALRDQGLEVVLVSSGGVALGRSALKIAVDRAPSTIPLPLKQASSSIGQYHMYDGYKRAFVKHGIDTAQILLTLMETENRRLHLNARETLSVLLDHGIIPVINENDVISTAEIRFGDNDRLAVRVAQMLDADHVILLSTIDGLYSANPHEDPSAEHIPLVEAILPEHIEMAGDAVPGLSTGGMKSKMQAALAATDTGIGLLITDGRAHHPLRALQDGAMKSTYFTPQRSKVNARKSWIGSHLAPKGHVMIDAGAAKALRGGGSLLPVGVRALEGDFARGDILEIMDLEGHVLGRGIAAYSAPSAAKIIGKQSDEFEDILGFAGRNELIHRNDLVLDQQRD